MQDTVKNAKSSDTYLDDNRQWRKRKKQAFAVAKAYDFLGHENIARDMRICGTRLIFDVYADEHGGAYRRTNEFNYFCRQRQCPLCQMVKSRKAFFSLAPIYEEHLAKHPNRRAIHLVLTVPNMWGDILEKELDALKLGIRRFTRCKGFKSRVHAWYRALEVTWNAKRFDFHPHYHLLLIVDEDYFTPTGKPGSMYLHQSEWLLLWQRSMNREDIKILHVERVRMVSDEHGDVEPARILWEMTKYVTKPSSFIPYNPETRFYECDPEVLYWLHHTLKGRHLTTKGGKFRGVISENLESVSGKPDADSFNGEQEPANPNWLADEVYRWTRHRGGNSGYVLVPSNHPTAKKETTC